MTCFISMTHAGDIASTSQYDTVAADTVGSTSLGKRDRDEYSMQKNVFPLLPTPSAIGPAAHLMSAWNAHVRNKTIRQTKAWQEAQLYTGKGPWTCKESNCTKVIPCTQKARYKLFYHLLSHTDERPFACQWPHCSRKFKTNGALKIHTRNHTNEYPFQCDVPSCAMKFVTSSKLKDHKNIHAAEKKYLCPVCKTRCKQPNGLRAHMKRIHPEHPLPKPASCKIMTLPETPLRDDRMSIKRLLCSEEQ